VNRSALLLVWISTAAAAHTGIAQSLSVTLRQGNDKDVLVSTTFGAVITRDHGGSWKSICEEAIGYGTGQRPAWWLSPTGAMFAGSFKGLFVDRGDGCLWESLPDFENTGCSDIQAAGTTVLATSGKYGVENQILRSTDDGRTWVASPEKSSTLFYSTLRIAPSNPDRVYAAAWWFSPNTSILLRSDDNGRTFARIDLTATLPAAGAFYVLGVHPTKSEVVFASVVRDAEPRAAWLLKSIDSGATFTPVVTTPEVFSAVAFGADPQIVYGASGNALYRSTNGGESFTVLPSPQRNACVTTQADRVYTCGLQELDGWAVGEGDGLAFDPLLKWSRISGPISCPVGSAVQMLCEPLWPVVKATFPFEADAGIPDAGTDGGTEPPPPPRGCGCATLDGPLWLAIVLFLRRPRLRC
jgi:hypothetical protein